MYKNALIALLVAVGSLAAALPCAAQEAAQRHYPAVGEKFVDFAVSCDGTTQRLSDYVGRGKYVLVDFWASWCPPCKEELPNIIAVYNKYGGERFTVVGVATWDEPAATRAAIAQYAIPYPQILNAQRIGSDAYGIMGIPEIILFGPDGTILARGLRGEEIERAVGRALR